jgi:hypothetical protein
VLDARSLLRYLLPHVTAIAATIDLAVNVLANIKLGSDGRVATHHMVELGIWDGKLGPVTK